MATSSRLCPLLAAFAGLLLLASCGTGSKNIPRLIGSFPADHQTLPGGLSLIRLEFDEPVTLLNPESVEIRAGGALIPNNTFMLPGEPSTVYVVPEASSGFVPDTLHSLSVIQGLVINAEGHYADDVEGVTFTLGPVGPIAAGAPQAVKLLDRETFALLSTVPTPNAAADTVVGVLTTESAAGRRYWVQRSDPGSGMTSLAFFDDGDVTMTEVPLPLSSGASVLMADFESMALDPGGDFLYVAFREEPEQHVRVFRVDVDTPATVTALTASTAPGATTMPTGMDTTVNRQELLLAVEAAGAGEIVGIDLETFTEIDRDAGTGGVQSLPLPQIPRGITAFGDRYVLSSIDGSGTANVQQYLLFNGLVAETPSTTTGVGAQSLRTLDFFLSVQTVSGYADGFGLVVRALSTGYATPTPVLISDDVGGVSQGASSVIAMVRPPSSNQFLAVLDGGLVARFFWDGFNGVFQEDLDDVTDGIQVVDGGADWSDITVLGREFGQFPP